MAKRQSNEEIERVGDVLSKKFKREGDSELCSSDLGKDLSADNVDAAIKDTNSCFRLTERDVGITEYIADHSGFNGIIKQRFSDFLVHEIDQQSNVVELNNTSLPADKEVDLPQPEELFDQEIQNGLLRLSEDEKVDPLIINVSDKSKDDRRLIHELISKMHPNLSTNTEDRNGEKVIIVTREDAAGGGRNSGKSGRGVRQKWPSTRGNYTKFVLYKENIDTMEAVNLIAKMVGMKPGVFTYAGVKDRRAKTTQNLTVYRTEAQKLLNLNKRLRNMVIGNVTYVNEPLRLGNLWGNRFNIVLRNVCGTEEEIKNAMKSLETNGFLNYYGMQRFGTTTVPTHEIGLALLKSDWATAIDLILQPRPEEDENMTFCRNLWKQNENPKKILSLMKKKNCPEAHLLRGLAKHGKNDLVNALNEIPRNTRLMYAHSYQSLIWNRMLSKRFQKHGTHAVDGDLYMTHADQSDEDACIDSEAANKPKPNFVTSNENMVAIEDVVLPLFGHNVIYPKNDVAKWYEEILADDGLDINDIKHKIKDYSLPGSYRSMIVKPKNVRWSLLNYDDPHIPLLQSDWSRLQNKDAPPSPTSCGSLRAMIVQFDLPRSSYATMALREVLRIDTSSNHQKALNPSS